MDIQDLAKLNESSNSGVWVNIKNPLTQKDILIETGDQADGKSVSKPLRFKVCGVTSDRYYKLRDQIQAEQFQIAFEKAQSDSKADQSDDDEAGMRMVAGMVLEVDGLEINGKSCGPEDCMAIFKTKGLRFIYNQLDIDIKRRTNFTQP